MSIKFYGRAESVAKRILDLFAQGDVPTALAPVFICRRDNVPCRKWSWANQLLVALAGTSDARGIRQWNQTGRKVKRGARAFHILVPMQRKVEDEEKGEERWITYGFKTAPVFRMEDTQGDPVPSGDPEIENWLANLPLRDVATHWGIRVETFDGEGAHYRGYIRANVIALGVKNMSAWAHEMTHEADRRCTGELKGGQHLDQEVVAQLGASTLLKVLGHDIDADLGFTWEYIGYYSQKHKKQPIVVCQQLLQRTCNAVALILDTAEELKQQELVAVE